ncbi:MAG: protein kinase [Ardenticatenaceae bacterium]|nr:protein kinase [Ardenticatenaceae bacterium]
MQNLIGQQIDSYRIETIIGSGGMGTVFQAHDINLERPVAIKVMRQQYASQPQFQHRFQQEARTAARLNHPSIVQVYQFGRFQDYLYIVMEYVRGLSLGGYMKHLAEHNQIVKLNEVLTTIAQVADALGYAHRNGVIHRDIKPDNILIKPLDLPDRPHELPLRSMVTDFGLAKLIEGGMETQTGTFMGTLPYMSPEHVLDQPLDGRSDIYSLGVVLYQLATGKLPHTLKTPTDAVMKHLHSQPVPPIEYQAGLPPHINDIILTALAKEPENRFQTAETFASTLREAAANLTHADITAFELDSDVSSVVTMLEARPEMPVEARPPDEYRLIVVHEDDTPQTHKLNHLRMVIGRAQDCDIPLLADNISRYHASLEWTGQYWQLTDLGSTNGTYLDGVQLIPEDSVPFYPHQACHIGPYTLQLQSTREPLIAPRPSPLPSRPSASPPPPPANRFSFDIRPQEIKQQGICRVLLLNLGPEAASYTLTAVSPTTALTITPPQHTTHLAAGQKAAVDFLIEVQKRPLIGRKNHPFHITVSNGTHEHTLAGTAKA